MRNAAALILLSLLAVGCRSASTPGPAMPPLEAMANDSFAVMTEADRLASRDLWPGFDPRTIPVAIHDGERTLLFRHPTPPEGFLPLSGHEGVWEFPGRHPDVTANSSAELGGVQTATLMPAATDVPLRSRAALLLHEAFHVFQREHHPAWSANEVELFTYPVDDVELLALRRLETEALRRALASGTTDQAACWARTALGFRQQRFAALPAGAAAYERNTELNEGLATYVERRATGETDGAPLPVEGFAPEAVRQRGYQTGLALARLLDRFSPAWRTTLEQDDAIALDVLLSTAPATRDSAPSCGFTPKERDRVLAAAADSVISLRGRRDEQRRAFLEQPGWTLVIAAPTGTPLFPEGFDPLNVQVVGAGEVLHTRFVKLGNESGRIEVLGQVALTEAAGEHPLFQGVRMVAVSGLANEPLVTEANGVVTVKADGVAAALHGATVVSSGQTVTIRLPSGQ